MTFLTIVIDLNPNLFRIGPFLITWHGVFAVLGILAGARLGLWLLEKDGVDTTRSADGVAWMVGLGLVGARLLYVWENFRLFAGGQILRVFALTEGGISQWGGLFGAMAGAYVWARRARFSYWKLIDASGAAAMVGLAVGRIGDVINGEHHGIPTVAPWGVEYVNPATLGEPGVVVHPEVAYEMVLTLVLLGALLPFHQRLKARLPDGVLGLIYLGLYAIGRFFLSFYRTDPAVFAGLRQAQLASLLMVALAAIAIPLLYRHARAAGKPTVAEPAEVEPQISAQPAHAEPEIAQPAHAEPEIAQPAHAEPEIAQPAHAELEIAQPAHAEMEIADETVDVEPAIPAIAEPEPATPDRASDTRGPRRARRPRTRPPQSTT
jgi:phosphatidylglycerol:prolipoprotein diacylglycerol transferase